jgi:hypothetical protein
MIDRHSFEVIPALPVLDLGLAIPPERPDAGGITIRAAATWHTSVSVKTDIMKHSTRYVNIYGKHINCFNLVTHLRCVCSPG